jgi:syntenin-1
MISPVTGQGNKGLMRAEIKGGVREVIACKDSEGKIGLRLRNVNNVSISYLPKIHYSN